MRVLVLEWTPLLGVGIVSLNRDHKVQYAGYPSHKAAHDRLRADARDFLLNIEGAYTRTDLPVVARYFRYWLIHHMVVEDAKISAFVERGWETSALGPPRHEEEGVDHRQTVHSIC